MNKAVVAFPNQLPGKKITLQKFFDPATGKSWIASDDGSVNSGDALFRLEEAERTSFRARNGRLNGDLARKLEKMKGSAVIKVIVTLKPPAGINYLPREGYTPDQLKASSEAIAKALPIRSFESVLSPHAIFNSVTVSEYESIVEVTKDKLQKLAFDGDVAAIEEYIPAKTQVNIPLMMPAMFGAVQWDDISTLAKSAYNQTQNALPTNLANGVRAATFESGLTQSFVGCINSPAKPITIGNWEAMLNPGPGFNDSIHSLCTFTNLVNAAPGARFYHRRSWNYNDANSQNYIINHGIHTVSLSVTNSSSTTDAQNMRVDDWAYRYPYPVVVTPTGNTGWWNVPNWAGSYNAINVGNVQDKNFTHFEIDNVTCSGGATQTRNPTPVAGGCIDGGTFPNCAGDREMPYIVGPGWAPHANVTADCKGVGYFMRSNCINNVDQTWGTSMSIPTVNGMAANLLGQANFLINHPEGVRAILTLTARNVTGGYWQQSVDGLDGAGVVNGSDAIAFAKTNKTFVTPGGAAAVHGYWQGEFGQSDFTPVAKNKVFNIRIPNPIPAGKHLRMIVTWNSSPDFTANVNDLSDIDMYFNNGAYSANSYNSNIEMIDVENAALVPGAIYPVSINPLTWRRHSGSRSSTTYAAVAWTYVTDHAH